MSRARVASLVAGLSFAAAALFAAPAGAAAYPNGGTTPTTAVVAGETVTAPAAAAQTPGTSLPFTGGDVLGVTGIGLAAVAVGGAMIAKGRGRKREA